MRDEKTRFRVFSSLISHYFRLMTSSCIHLTYPQNKPNHPLPLPLTAHQDQFIFLYHRQYSDIMWGRGFPRPVKEG